MSVPGWLKTLTDNLALRISSTEETPPLACHFHVADGLWEVTLFLSKTELVGGSQDGIRYDTPFSLNLTDISQHFDGSCDISWQSDSDNSEDELGPHLAITGFIGQERVHLRILARSPERFGVGRFFHLREQRFETVW